MKIKEKSVKCLIALVALLVPSIVAGIRYGIGTDYYSYLSIFENIKSGNEVRTEIGFNFLNLLVANMGGNIHVLFFLISFLTFLFIYLSLHKYRKSISVGLGMFIFMLLFYHDSFNGVRQVLAVSILLYSFNFIIEKRFWKFLITVLLASSFHLSSLVVLPFYYIYNRLGERSNTYRLGIYIVVVLLVFNYDSLLNVFISLSPDLTYYSKYLSNGGFSFGLGQIVLNAPYIIPGLIFYNKFKNNSRFKFFFFFMIIGIIIKFVGYLGVEHLSRIADTFFIAVVMVVPFYFRNLKNSLLEWFCASMIILFIIFIWFYNYIYIGYNETVPFKTFFSM